MRARFALALAAACASVPLLAQTSGGQTAPAATKQPFDKAQAEGVVTKLATTLEDNFVFPDKGRAYAERLRAQLAAGAYSSFPDGQAFAEKVTEDLQAVHKDGHLRLHVVPRDAREGPAAAGQGQRVRRGPGPSSGVAKSGWLADGVAYIRFDGFPGNDVTIADLRKFLETHGGAKTLIIDARMHRGGGLTEMDVLFPQMFAKPTTLVAMDTREAVDRREGNPIDDASLRKVSAPAGVVRREHFVSPASSQSGLVTAKVFLLTSKRTASAGEHLALSLKRTKRATLIGETTAGAGHYGGMASLGHGYSAFIPVGRTFDPDTNLGWEGTGVKPDVEVPADQALDEALKLAGVNKTAELALAGLR